VSKITNRLPFFRRFEVHTSGEGHQCKLTLNLKWDVFAFKNGTVRFIECKRKGEQLTSSQRDWIAAALDPKTGFTPENFLFVEWTATPA
jgi:hypothetical protein